MTFLRWVLSVFAVLNVVFWAVLSWVWAIRPSWASRLPFRLGTDDRYRKPVPVWARLAAAFAAFWSVAAVLYLTTSAAHPLALIALIVLAAIFLILGIGAAARVYTVLQLPRSAVASGRRQQVH
jgi:hypothetical protein